MRLIYLVKRFESLNCTTLHHASYDVDAPRKMPPAPPSLGCRSRATAFLPKVSAMRNPWTSVSPRRPLVERMQFPSTAFRRRHRLTRMSSRGPTDGRPSTSPRNRASLSTLKGIWKSSRRQSGVPRDRLTRQLTFLGQWRMEAILVLSLSVSLEMSLSSPGYSFIHSFVHSFIRSFIRSFIHSFIHACMNAFIHSFRSTVHYTLSIVTRMLIQLLPILRPCHCYSLQ